MKLPAEIRLKILRKLLWHAEPLKALRETSEPANNLRPRNLPLTSALPEMFVKPAFILLRYRPGELLPRRLGMQKRS